METILEKPERCPWAKDEYDITYHDSQWGKPVYDDHILFEMLILEGMQAGLSWNLILRRREAMREAFDGFDAEIIRRYDKDKLEKFMQDPNLIRNRRKLEALAKNANAFLETQKVFGSFSNYFWQFTDGGQIVNHWEREEDVPCDTPLSARISKDLKKRGFSFVGPTIVYSFMQGVGMVNDHMVWCREYHNCNQSKR